MREWRQDAFDHSPEDFGHDHRSISQAKLEAQALWFDPNTRTELSRYPDMEIYAYLFVTARGGFYYAVTDLAGAHDYAAQYECRVVEQYDGIQWEAVA
ncbi:MAG: hypothetical protein IT324_19540 [Anaerolineae bacterium]|nr:hypothetical protein [Anaerolineae bacterium]